jgi:hypothetical protein
MKKTLALFLMLTPPFVAPDVSEARQKISLQAAESVCLQRAERFVRTPYGRDASGPTPNQVKDRYRACVYAKSGRYPSSGLNIRGVRITVTPRLRR